MAAPLTGITIVDLTRVLSGPYCTMVLADLGARVIKIEHPSRGDDTRHWGPPFVGDESAYFLCVNRNKESVTLDFKRPEGREALDRLAARADVLVENFRPGTLDKVGCGWPDMHARHPRLIYASISGYGQSGPRREEPGYDAVIQAEGGLMSITGDENGTAFRLGVAISDIVAGLFTAQAIVAALFARERTGEGQFVDVGMLDATAALLTYQAANFFTTGQTPVRMGNRHPTIAPYETFDTADGDLVIAVGNESLWQRFCAGMEMEALATDPRFATNRDRLANYDALKAVLDERFRGAPRDEWIARLGAAGVPCGAVRDVGEVLSDPQLHARDMIANLMHPTAGAIRVMGTPMKLSATPGSLRLPPPLLGQHTDGVLAELGYDHAAVAAMRTAGVV
jgi:crotonobetainyl-CoA:carnitine CoA-transferase CaiB-like acyl-CoA transferase